MRHLMPFWASVFLFRFAVRALYFYFILFPPWGGEEAALPTFPMLPSFFCQANNERYWPPCKVLAPSPSETWLRGMRVWEGLSGGCRAGLTLERWSQLSLRLSRLAEKQRRYGWLGMLSKSARLFRAPI